MKSMILIASHVNSICPNLLNQNVIVLKLFKELLLTFIFVGQIAYHGRAIEKTIPMVIISLFSLNFKI